MESTTLFTAALGLKEPWNIRFRPLERHEGVHYVLDVQSIPRWSQTFNP